MGGSATPVESCKEAGECLGGIVFGGLVTAFPLAGGAKEGGEVASIQFVGGSAVAEARLLQQVLIGRVENRRFPSKSDAGFDAGRLA
ncbi:hypothetical protein D9V34_16680 [Mycetocola lacteus]|uniref:Uncharacterized protein n=1 Tax=Mycetocola lacteus TaxID=76637 RepID=A0A3L7AH95_9MICO|nr:hypothetical protein D9V34_16680 [Mycetocola lacteus]